MNQQTSEASDSAAPWTRYWQSGFQDTCFFADRAFAVDQLWQDLFSELDSSARIVDLATGNGAVALKAATFARDHNRAFAISGVDYATIAPAGLTSTDAELVASVEFVGDTDIANLPFHSSSVDCLTSQYGFEYARGDLALAEAVRVLVTDGRALFLMHAEGGAVHEASAARLRRAQSLLQKGHLMMQLDDLAKALKSGSKSRVYKTQQRVEAKVAAAQRKHAEIPKDDLVWQISQESREILAAIPQVAGADIAARIAHIRAEVTAYVHRLHAMLKASRSARAMDELCDKAQSLGCGTATYTPFMVDEQQVGWSFSARKS